MYYKVEAYTASERAGALLYAQNITPTYVSDNPVTNSQHVVFQAARAYGNGLPYHAALASVTSASAELLGLGHRIGKIKSGYDADIVVWDSDPLHVGAAPVQVFIDGAKQFKEPVELKKPILPPITPNAKLEKELKLQVTNGTVVFTGITHAHHTAFSKITQELEAAVAIVSGGALSCVGSCTSELAALSSGNTPKTIKLRDGYLTPPFTAFGTALGLQEIDAARDTHDGKPPSDGISFAVDGLLFGGKQLTAAFEHGVTRAISAPSYSGIESKGVSVGFKTGAKNRLVEGAVWAPDVALHYSLTLSAKNDKTPSISSAIGDLTAKLLDAIDELSKNNTDVATKAKFQESAYLQKVVQGSIPLVLSAHSADTIASIIHLKSLIESSLPQSALSESKLKFVIIGGAEAHLVAPELAASDISLVLAPLLPHAQSWDQRRGLTGPPLTNVSTNVLLDAGVLLGISVEELSDSRNLGLLAGIAHANSEGRLSFEDALGLVSGNLEKALEVQKDAATEKGEWVIWEGSPLQIGGRVRGIGGLGRASLWV